MKNSNKGFTVLEIVINILSLGWVLNIVKMVSHINAPMTGMEILRMIGIVVAPLGAVLGYL